MIVIEVNNTKTLMIQGVQGLFQRMLKTHVLLKDVPLDALAEDLFNWIEDDDTVLLLGMESGKHSGLVMIQFPTSQLAPVPIVTMLYNEGSVAMGRELLAKTVDTVSQRGYTNCIGTNGSGRSDKAWLRYFTPKNWTSHVIGGTAMFEVG